MSFLFNPSRKRWPCVGSPQNKHLVGHSHSPSDVSLSSGAQFQRCHDTDDTRVTGNWLLSPCKQKNTYQGQWNVAQDRKWNRTAEVALPVITPTALWTIEMLAAMHQTIRGSLFWRYPFPNIFFFLTFIYETRRRTSYKRTSKYGISPLLHVSTCLCHPQEVHTPNLKLAKI